MAKRSDASGDIGGLGFLWRFLAALVLVMATYNPSGYSAYHWISGAISSETESFGPLHLLVVGVLLAAWAVFWIATWRALGTLGVVLASIILGALIWLLFDIGLLESHSYTTITWIGLFCFAAVLALGVSWSHFWRRVTGQVNVEHVDD